MTKHECLSDALCAAQAEFPAILKERTANVGKYSYNYADLSDVIAAVTPVLARHGLCQLQRMAVRDGHQLLVTELRHKQEVVASEMILPIEGQDPQTVGKLITYARRYALQAMLGVAAEKDDDAADTGEVRQPAAPRPDPRFVGLHERVLGVSNSAALHEVADEVRAAWRDLLAHDRTLAGLIQRLVREKAQELGVDLHA